MLLSSSRLHGFHRLHSNPLVCVSQGQTPRGGNKSARPDRVRGRAMSIHHQSDKYFITPQPPPPAYTTRRSSQAVPNPGHSRQPSLEPASPRVTAGYGRPSLARTSRDVKTNFGRPSSLSESQNPKAESRRSSQFVASKPVDDEQPSARDLLKMAMKNTVMYAVKHVDKLKIDDDDDDDEDSFDDDDYDSDEDFETRSQYRHGGLIVVTKEGDSDDDEDDVNIEARSAKTLATRRSEVSRRSFYGGFDDDDSDEGSPSFQRPWSRTSTTLTSISQISAAVTARKFQREMATNTPRTRNPSSKPQENRPSSFGINTARKSASRTIAGENTSSSLANTPRKTNPGLPTPRERGTSTSVDTNRSVSGTPRLSQSKKKTVQISDASTATPRQGRTQDKSPYNATAKSTSSYPKSGSSRRSDVSHHSIMSKRSTSVVRSPNNEKKSKHRQNGKSFEEDSALHTGSARTKVSLAEDIRAKTSARSYASTARTTRSSVGGSEKTRVPGSGHLSRSERVDLKGGNGDKRAVAVGASGNSKSLGRDPSGTRSRDLHTFLPDIAR